MKQSQANKRRSAGIASAKVVIASASLAATVGGWALISATADPTTDANAASLSEVASAPDVRQQAPLQPDINSDARAQTPSSGGNGWEWTPNGEDDDQRRSYEHNDDSYSDDEAQAVPQVPGISEAPSQAAPQSPFQQQQPRVRTRSSR